MDDRSSVTNLNDIAWAEMSKSDLKRYGHEASACITRRSALVAGGTIASLSVLGLKTARSQVAASTYTFAVGFAEITVVSDGAMTLPLSFLLPTLSDIERETFFSNRRLPTASVTNAVNVALVKTPTDLILFDSGGGDEFLPGLGRCAQALESLGIKPESVTKIIFTHAHPDHLWGALDPLDDSTRFPNATHYMSGVEFDYWSAADVQARVAAPFKPMAAGTKRRLALLADRIDKRRAGDEIAPGVTLIDTPGHTPGHLSVLLTSGSERLLIGGDVLTHHAVSFEKPAWRWGADMDADAAIVSRTRTLDMLATDRVPLLGYHLPWPGIGRVERKDTAFRFVPV